MCTTAHTTPKQSRYCYHIQGPPPLHDETFLLDVLQLYQGRKRMLLMGRGGAELVGNSTYLVPGNVLILLVYALKSVLVHSETNIILKMDPYY